MPQAAGCPWRLVVCAQQWNPLVYSVWSLDDDVYLLTSAGIPSSDMNMQIYSNEQREEKHNAFPS